MFQLSNLSVSSHIKPKMLLGLVPIQSHYFNSSPSSGEVLCQKKYFVGKLAIVSRELLTGLEIIL